MRRVSEVYLSLDLFDVFLLHDVYIIGTLLMGYPLQYFSTLCL